MDIVLISTLCNIDIQHHELRWLEHLTAHPVTHFTYSVMASYIVYDAGVAILHFNSYYKQPRLSKNRANSKNKIVYPILLMCSL